MRVLFLQDSAINESLALTEASGCLLAAGHQTRLLLSDEEPELGRRIAEWDPALTVVPCSVAGVETARSLAQQARRAGSTFVLMAGTHATLDTSIAKLPEVDAVCVGEAERPLLDLADRLQAGASWWEVPSLAFERNGAVVENPLAPLVDDLDALAMPDRELYYRYDFIARFPFRKFSSGRGCIHSCTFCWNSTVKEMVDGLGTFVRRKSPRRMVDEIRAVVERHPTRIVHFSDDLFTIWPRWLEEFAELYRQEIALPFTCNTSIELVTEPTVDALRDAGCQGVAIGIETGNEDLRSRILAKTVSNDDVRRAARLIKSRGLELTTFNMLGSPGETLEDALSTVALNREIGADHVRCNLVVPLPHTDFEQRAQDDGRLAADYGARRIDGLGRPQVAFETEDETAFVNLFYLFRVAVHVPRLDPLVRRLLRLPTPRLLAWLRLLIPFEEKRIYHLRWRDGLRYFAHVGDPHKRTTNYVTLP